MITRRDENRMGTWNGYWIRVAKIPRFSDTDIGFFCRDGYEYYLVKNFRIRVGYGIDNTRQIPANAGSDTGIQRSGTRIHKCGMLALAPLRAATLAHCRLADFRALD